MDVFKTRSIPTPYERTQVECECDRRPVAFTHHSRRLEIVEIIDRWYEGGANTKRPIIDYFKVKATDGQIYMLRYLSLFDAWSVRV